MSDRGGNYEVSLRHTRRYTLLLCALISWLATPGYEATAAERVTTRDIIVQATRAEEEAKFESQQKTNNYKG